MAKNELDLQMEDYQYLPLRDVVFRTLRQAILRGELKPGERLMEIRLANQLGVSRTPIREAIRMLELDGLVIMVPRKGAGSTDHGKRPERCAGGAAWTGGAGGKTGVSADYRERTAEALSGIAQL